MNDLHTDCIITSGIAQPLTGPSAQSQGEGEKGRRGKFVKAPNRFWNLAHPSGRAFRCNALIRQPFGRLIANRRDCRRHFRCNPLRLIS